MFNVVRFTPLNSQALKDGDTLYTAGLMELELYVLPVNPAATLLVKIGQGEYANDGFSHAHDTVLNTATTVTAPESMLRTLGGNARLTVSGYVLEEYNFDTATWEVKTESHERSYAFTPAAGVSQRLTWIADETSAFYQMTAESDAHEANVVSFSPASSDGYYREGTEVTATAVLPAGATLVGWAGDVADVAGTDGSTITFTADRPRTLVPIFNRAWQVSGSGDAMVLTDGAWTFTAAAVNAAQRTLKVVKWQSGSGRLNLDTPVTHTDTSEAWTITHIAKEAMSDNMKAVTALTDLTLPQTLVQVADAAFRSQDASILTLTNLVFICPELTSLGTTAFTRQKALTKAVIRLPKLETMGAQYIFYNAQFAASDFSQWDFSALKAITYRAFHCEYSLPNEECGCAGKLSFPSLETIGEQVFRRFCPAAEIELGTARGSLQSIAQGAFKEAQGITNFVIGCRANLTVGTEAFANMNAYMGGGVQAVRFTHHAPTRTALEEILAGNSSTQMARISVSQFNREWEDYATPTETIDDEDVRARAEAQGANGAFKTAAGEWKAFFFVEKQPSDPRGTIITVR